MKSSAYLKVAQASAKMHRMLIYYSLIIKKQNASLTIIYALMLNLAFLGI